MAIRIEHLARLINMFDRFGVEMKKEERKKKERKKKKGLWALFSRGISKMLSHLKYRSPVRSAPGV